MPTSIDFSGRFGGTPTGYELIGNWPAGLSINSSGVVSGTATVAGYYPGLRVRATNNSISFAETNTFAMTVSKFAALVPAFEGDMKGVEVGTGDLTTTHAADLYAQDVDGVYRQFAANESVWSGGRVVNNYFGWHGGTGERDSSDWTKLQITESGMTVVDSQTLDYTTVNSWGGASMWGSGNRPGAGRFVARITILPGGTIPEIGIRIAGLTVNPFITIYPTAITEPTVYSIPFDVEEGDTGIVNFTFDARDGLGGTGTHTGTVKSTDMQVEYFGQSTNEIPGEYVRRVSATPDLTYATKTFANANGNTVTDNVVTEGVGDPLTEVPYLQHYPAATNELTYSNDLTAADWVLSVGTGNLTYDQTGLTGEPNTASFAEDTDGTQTTEVRRVASETIPADTNWNTAVFYIKKDNDQTRFPQLEQRNGSGGANRALIQLNTETGEVASYAPTGNVDFESIDAGDWWKVLVSVQNDGGATSTAVRLAPAYTTSFGGAAQNATLGSVIVGNVEFYLNKTIAEVRGLGPIFTTTAPVATDASIYLMDEANHPVVSGAYYAEKSTTGTSSGNIVTVGLTSAEGRINYGSNTQFATRCEAGTSAFINHNTPSGAIAKWGMAYSNADNQKQVNVNDTWGAAVSFTQYSSGANMGIACDGGGSFPIPSDFKFRNLRAYVTNSIAEAQAIIDELMQT